MESLCAPFVSFCTVRETDSVVHMWWRPKQCTTKINVWEVSAFLICMCHRIQISAIQQMLAVTDNW